MKFYSKEFKEEVIQKIKSTGKPASKVAEEYGINVKNVYNWLRTGAFKDASILEIGKLRRENQELLEIIGRLTVSLSKREKKQYGKYGKTN